MKVIFGGVRGSGPVTGDRFAVHGGDTTSVLVWGALGERIVIDAGTGLANLLPRLGEPTEPLVLLLTHYHLDHLMGLPNFTPLYQRERSLKLVGPVPPSGRPDTWQALTTLMGEPYWPVALSEAGAMLVTADVSCRDGNWLGDVTREFLPVGSLEVRACPVAHPGGGVAWRIDEPSSGGSFVFATDLEWGQTSAEQRLRFLKFCQEPRPVSLLVMDGHFDETEYAAHAGWGHSTWQEVASVGASVGADQIGVTHHAPGSDDEMLDDRTSQLAALVRELGSDAKAFCVRQGQELEITGPIDTSADSQRHAGTVLLMVQELHRLGYQRLRIAPGVAGSGQHWRCAITHAANIRSDHGALVQDEQHDTAMYSTGTGDRFFGWADAREDSPAELARKFVERFPVIVRLGRGDDEAYQLWLKGVIDVVAGGDLPIAYSDWPDETEAGILPTIGGSTRLPFPPGGEG